MTLNEFWKSLMRQTGTKSVREASKVLLTLAGIKPSK